VIPPTWKNETFSSLCTAMPATNVSGKETNETLATNQIVASSIVVNVEVSVEK